MGGPLAPFVRFFRTEAASGVLLLACAVVALAWANSPWAESYFHLWEIQVRIGAGARALSMSLHHWINDGLMAVFFFVVGLEVKRELLVGELASPRRAALPVAAALGGMVVPAAIYALVNAGGPGSAGWGVPMATDIAFALGVLALLGTRAPAAMKVFLAALAIADDIGAVLVIAFAYSSGLDRGALLAAAGVLVILALLNRGGIRRPAPYALLGVVLWFAVLKSGIHATIAGVLLATTIPARCAIDDRAFARRARDLVNEFEAAEPPGRPDVPGPAQVGILQALASAAEAASSPLQRIQHHLHGIVAFLIMPLFALANAGVAIGAGGLADRLAGPVSLGIVLGLLVGKPVGIVLFSWIAMRTGFAVQPTGVTWRHFLGVGLLGGIGFTMALFIADLAFAGTALHDEAKVGVFAGSLLAGVAGALVLRRAGRRLAAADSG
ncbi:MAG: Na+/H+ antiporter NhaA [Gemmatimonadales bacterium]